MTDEEKKAIEFVKSELQDEKKKARDDYQSLTGLYGNLEIEILLNLIEKQQKEIEELKDINKKLEARKYMLNARTGEVTAIPIDNNYISKDKIKAKIEEIEKLKTDDENSIINKIVNWFINQMQSLLEEKE